MSWAEIRPRGLYECDSQHAIEIPKGAYGKTKGRLIGCFIPIICYESAVVLGHFGPGRLEDARRRLGTLVRSDQPITVQLYRDNLGNLSYWNTRKVDYLNFFREMRIMLAEMTGLTTRAIKTQKYISISDVIVDWSNSEALHIYAQRSSKTGLT